MAVVQEVPADTSREERRQIATISDDLDILPGDMNKRIERTKLQIEVLNRLLAEVLQPGVDYMVIPGTPKPTLLQDGAHQLCRTFHLQPEFRIEDKTENHEADPPFLAYFCRCRLYHRSTGMLIAEGIGAANSYEARYRYRWVDAPPEQQKQWASLKHLPHYRNRQINGKWVLQQRVSNPDIYDLQNTLVKMAKKRAYVDAVLNATGASRLFTQDLEDIGHILAAAEQDDQQYDAPAAAVPGQADDRLGSGQSAGKGLSKRSKANSGPAEPKQSKGQRQPSPAEFEKGGEQPSSAPGPKLSVITGRFRLLTKPVRIDQENRAAAAARAVPVDGDGSVMGPEYQLYTPWDNQEMIKAFSALDAEQVVELTGAKPRPGYFMLAPDPQKIRTITEATPANGPALELDLGDDDIFGDLINSENV